MNRNISVVGLLLFFLMVVAAGSLAAQVRDLSTDEFKRLQGQSGPLLIIDTRTDQEFNRGHIRGAVNISSQASNQFRTIARLLPEDKGTTLVFYCRGYN